MNTIDRDTTSRTGKNLRRIMMESKRNDILDITVNDIMVKDYFGTDDDEEWKTNYIKDLLDERDQRTLSDEYTIIITINSIKCTCVE